MQSARVVSFALFPSDKNKWRTKWKFCVSIRSTKVNFSNWKPPQSRWEMSGRVTDVNWQDVSKRKKKKKNINTCLRIFSASRSFHQSSLAATEWALTLLWLFSDAVNYGTSSGQRRDTWRCCNAHPNALRLEFHFYFPFPRLFFFYLSWPLARFIFSLFISSLAFLWNKVTSMTRSRQRQKRYESMERWASERRSYHKWMWHRLRIQEKK